MKVIGLTGPLASGKTESAGILLGRGFFRVSLSDEVRKEADSQNRPRNRNVLQDIGDELRLKFGDAVLAQRVAASIDKLTSEGKFLFVIDGLKNPGEILWLKKRYNMRTIGITANPDLRFMRILDRQSESDNPLTSDELKLVMDRDMGVGEDSHGNNIAGCLRIVDTIIINEGSRDELGEKLDKKISEFKIEGKGNTK